MRALTHISLGRADYTTAARLQERLVEEVLRDDRRAYLVTVEHAPAVITLGRRGEPADILAPRQRLADEGIEVHTSSRGGQATYHGPGQLVAYPIWQLGRGGRSVHGHVRLLECAIISLLDRFDIDASRLAGAVGVYVGLAKIASIGVAVRRWVCCHGLALNVQPDLSRFQMIVPCGRPDEAATSMAEQLGRRLDMTGVLEQLVARVCEVCDFDEWRSADADIFSTDLRESHVYAGQPTSPAGRLPTWLRRSIPPAAKSAAVRNVLGELHLATVCTGAKCPNRAECFACGRATFMILGGTCTRSCGFCAVVSGRPEDVRDDEPQAVAEACARLGLRHVVITSVTRDDLPDGGAGQFARTIAAVRSRLPKAVVEVLTPDFAGNVDAIDCVLDAACDIFNHNVETAPRLQGSVRPDASYDRSLGVLARSAARAGRTDHAPRTKSGLMVGLGETQDEVAQVMGDLRAVGCDILTIGQYLQPTAAHLPVSRYVEPDEFARLARLGRELGYAAVAAGPFVRSSYHAEEVFRSSDL